MKEIKRSWLKSNHFWMWSGYISIPNFSTFLPCVPKEMPGNCKFDLFHLVTVLPKSVKSTDCDQDVISSKGGQDTPACPTLDIPFIHSYENPWKPQISPVSLSQIGTKMRKNNRLWPKSNHVWRSSGTSTCQISSHSSHGFSRICQEMTNLTCFTEPKSSQNEENQQNMTKI